MELWLCRVVPDRCGELKWVSWFRFLSPSLSSRTRTRCPSPPSNAGMFIAKSAGSGLWYVQTKHAQTPSPFLPPPSLIANSFHSQWVSLCPVGDRPEWSPVLQAVSVGAQMERAPKGLLMCYNKVVDSNLICNLCSPSGLGCTRLQLCWLLVSLIYSVE